MREVSAQVVEELGSANELSGRIHESHMAFLARCRAYAPMAEGGFLAIRNG